jgi:uncharacterized protein YabN with tetrapyrrole methylase and pyrophosphatase domain
LTGPNDKIDEELAELRREIPAGSSVRQEDELGDLLFAVTVLAQRLSLNPEVALRKAVLRFTERFRRVEAELGDGLSSATIDALLEAWKRAKEATAREI